MTEDDYIDYYRCAAPGPDDEVTVFLQLPEREAEALAQFAKRVGWDDWRNNAKHDAEAGDMQAAFERLRAALAEAGFAPR